MKLGMEIPIVHLEHLSPLLDFDFAIAHRVLNNGIYRDFYAKQAESGRHVILDNGFHELGKPVDVRTLARAAELCKASIVIAPDSLDDYNLTWNSMTLCLEQMDPQRLAGAVVGDTRLERATLVDMYFEKKVGTICFPYRRDRVSWLEELYQDDFDFSAQNVHFLGMRSFEECILLQAMHPEATFDTSKPLKWAYRSARMDTLDIVHGGWSDYDSFLEAPALTQEQTEIALYNLCLLRQSFA